MEKRYYLASGAVVTGDVELGNDVSIWHNAVLRGDSGKITIGERTNIQDGCIVHEETHIGADCTVGHGAIVHGCTVVWVPLCSMARCWVRDAWLVPVRSSQAKPTLRQALCCWEVRRKSSRN